jgi:hypothetical protein
VPRYNLTDLANLQNETTATNAINANNATVEGGLDAMLSRTATSGNSMEANLDMNSNRILNLPAPAADTEPARKEDVDALAQSIALDELGNNAITNGLLRDSAGLSVIGRASDSTGDPADIIAETDGHVLRRSGNTIGFGAMPPGSLDAGSVQDEHIDTPATAADGVDSAKIKLTQDDGEDILLDDYLRRGPVNVARFGATGDGSTDDSGAIQDAIDYANANDLPVYFPFPAVYYKLATGLTSTQCMFYGDPGTTLFANRLNDVLLTLNINTDTTKPYITNLNFRSYFEGGDTHTSSVGILIDGDDSWFQHGRFSHLEFTGMHTGIKSTKTHVVTAFGNEGTIAWMNFDNIEFLDGEKEMSFGFHFPQGSGTGNSWTNIKGIITGAESSYLNMGDTGYVVGDILICDAHVGGDTGVTCLLRTQDGSVYHQRISIVSCQFDAGCDFPIISGTTNTAQLSNVRIVGCNFGGNTDFYSGLVKPLASSSIDDLEASYWNIGKRIQDNATGARTTNCFTLAIDDWSGCKVEAMASGLVSGVLNGVVHKAYVVTRGTGACSLVQIGSTAESASNPITLTVAASGNNVLVTVGYTPTSTDGSDVDVQLRIVGGRVKVTQH